MVKIKRKVEMTLPELIEWGFKNNVKDRGFDCNQANYRPVVFNSIGWIDFIDDYCYPPGDTYTVEVEEEITEQTVFKRFYEYTKGQSFMIYENTSISKIKDDFSREFWMKDGNTMTLVWKDGELVGDE
uniref:Phage protein n=1 Tax=Staphylococcus phage HS12 TaxID=3056402 RepID=A0AA49X3L4_9VIRU|nr:MAG: hypothetical protein [Staphylococcus phage HS12]